MSQLLVVLSCLPVMSRKYAVTCVREHVGMPGGARHHLWGRAGCQVVRHSDQVSLRGPQRRPRSPAGGRPRGLSEGSTARRSGRACCSESLGLAVRATPSAGRIERVDFVHVPANILDIGATPERPAAGAQRIIRLSHP